MLSAGLDLQWCASGVKCAWFGSVKCMQCVEGRAERSVLLQGHIITVSKEKWTIMAGGKLLASRTQACHASPAFMELVHEPGNPNERTLDPCRLLSYTWAACSSHNCLALAFSQQVSEAHFEETFVSQKISTGTAK